VVSPFHIIVEVLNKPEVIRRKVGDWFGSASLGDAANYVVTDKAFIKTVSWKLSEKMTLKAKEKAGIEIITWEEENQHTEHRNSTTFSMVVQIAGIDMAGLAEKALGLSPRSAEEFDRTYHQLRRILPDIGMAHKADEIEASVYTKVRWKVMLKLQEMLPSELRKEPTCLETLCAIPELDHETPPPPTIEIDSPELLGMASSDPFLIQAKIEDRKALMSEQTSQSDKSMKATLKASVSKGVGVHMPDVMFERMLEIKLRKQIPELLLAQAGLHVTCRRVRRRDERWRERKRTRTFSADTPRHGSSKEFDPEKSFTDCESSGGESPKAGETSPKEGFPIDGIIVEITINSYDTWPPTKLLTLSKGKQFCNGFVQLWIALEKLQELGVPGIVSKMVEVSSRIKDQVREGVGRKLQEVLSERLHARVRLLEGNKAEGYTEIKFEMNSAS